MMLTGDRGADIAALINNGLSPAEDAFGVAVHPRGSSSSVTGTQPAKLLPTGADGRPAAGALGVLVDDINALGMLGASAQRKRALSVEISMDFVAPLPAEGTLIATGSGTDVDGIVGHATGTVRDGSGRLLVTASQHGRFVDAPEPDVSARERPTPLRGGQVLSMLGASFTAKDGGGSLHLTDGVRWANRLGALHGGMAICAAEAAATCLSAEPALRTTSLTVAYARAMVADRTLRFDARLLHAGRTMHVIEVIGHADDRPCTYARVIRQASPGE